MVIQTIKAWLNKLFAWWPWKRSSATEYPQATSNMSKGMAQEQMWRSVGEAPMPQSGITSVVVEHGAGENTPEPQPLLGDEPSECVSPPAKHPEATGKDMPTLPSNALAPLPRHEQQLEFLRYLVQQGVINEGFAEGQVPTQYQAKQEE